jgi:WD40 repeat protein
VVLGLSWRSDGNRLATASMDTTVRVWDVDVDVDVDGRRCNVVQVDNKGVDLGLIRVMGTDFVLNSQLSQSSSSSSSTTTTTSTSTTTTTSTIVDVKDDFHTSRIRALAWHPDGVLLASASSDRTIRIWDVDLGTLSPHDLISKITLHFVYLKYLKQ